MASKNFFYGGLLGKSFTEFQEVFYQEPEEGDLRQIIASPARLIPVKNTDDEKAMASVFLSSIKYIKEYRNLISDPIGLSKSGTLYCFTEVCFPYFFKDDSDLVKRRFDGLAIVVSGGKIKDAVIFEMKQGKNSIEKEQIETYISMAKKLKIPRIVSISNQFVTKPTDYPIDINIPTKGFEVALYHYSWKYVLFLADLLLINNNLNIEDIDQQNIMKEVVTYLNSTKGISSFDSMTVSKWKDVVQDLGTSSVVRNDMKTQRENLIRDWIQEEKDLALKLSLQLSSKEFIPVVSDKKKYSSINDRVKKELLDLESTDSFRTIESVYKIQNAAAPLNVKVCFLAKTLTVSMQINVPTDRRNTARVTYIRGFIKKAQKYGVQFEELKDDISIILKSKSKRVEDCSYSIKDILDAETNKIDKDFDFNKVDVLMEYNFGRDILSPTKFISIIEDKVSASYGSLFQYFEKWVPNTPKISKPPVSSKDDPIEMEDQFSMEDSDL